MLWCKSKFIANSKNEGNYHAKANDKACSGRPLLQWVNACIAGYGKGETSSPFEYAGPFTESILIGNLAIRSFFLKNPNGKGWDDKYLGRKKLLWDAKNMKITNFDEANAFVKRDYRDGWKMTL